jgi:hypothetical protein
MEALVYSPTSSRWRSAAFAVVGAAVGGLVSALVGARRVVARAARVNAAACSIHCFYFLHL